ncbi:MAG: cytochrome c [Anaerolineae bacterium]|nr:cytochrome c [Anaerolineae bacterium]
MKGFTITVRLYHLNPAALASGMLIAVLLILVGCSTTITPTATALPPNSPEARGLALFSGKGRCATCHSLSPDTVIVGPSLAGVATRAASRESGLTAAEYLEESILLPDKIKAPGFENMQMDTSLAKTLTFDEISDLVAYLLTLK